VHHASFHNDLDRLVQELKRQVDPKAPSTETRRQQLEEHQKPPGLKIEPSIFAAVGNRVLPNEKGRQRSVDAALTLGLLAAVGAIGGFLIVALFAVSSPNVFGLLGVIATIAGGLCGAAAGILRLRYGVLVAVHISSVAWSLSVIVVGLFDYTFAVNTLSGAVRLLVMTFTFALIIFATVVLYEWVWRSRPEA
jgi:hypothetical protein